MIKRQTEKKKFLHQIAGMCIIAFMILGSVSISQSIAGHESNTCLTVLHSDEQSVVVKLKASDFQLETIKYEGQIYQKIIIPDTVQSANPGKPQVPTRGAMLGVRTVEGVSVQILDADYETLTGYNLSPSPVLKVTGDNLDSILEGDGVMQIFSLDETIYNVDAFYPDALIEIGSTGYLRNQPFVQVQCYPVQYNPVSKEIRLYHHIIAKITWDTEYSEMANRMREASPAYENLFKKNLLNYDTLERPFALKESRPAGNIITESAVSNDAADTFKIGVTEDGIYKLTYDELSDAGVEMGSLDPRKIKITNNGAEIPIYVEGEDDGVFDTSDFIFFYGTAITDNYTSKNIYWLTVGEDNGQRMSTQDGSLSGTATVPTYFPATVHAEENTYYWQTIPDGEGEDHWFWENKFNVGSITNYSIALNNISTTAGTASVRVRLKGYTDVKNTDPDHHSKISLNSTEIDDQEWNGQIIYDHEVSILHSYLNEGTNTVTVESAGGTGATVDQFFANWIEIDYLDTYVAEDDILLFSVPASGTYQFEVSGFSNNNVEVFNITDSNNVVRITNTTIASSGSAYTLKFEDTAQSETRYLALATSQRKSPDSIEEDQPTSWKSTGNEADYIIITHEDFYDSAQTLAEHRKNSGLKVVTAKVGDIYDEFNYGIFNPQAIRDFLSYAYGSWTTAPTYVVLVGDACQDYKDYYKTGTKNYVPSQVIETDILGETPSDNWYVLVSGDDALPDMYIGRLSAQKKSQADDIIDKIIYYEKHPPGKSWNKNALFIADDDSSSFEEVSEELAGLLPEGYTANKVYVSEYTSDGDPKKDMIHYIDKGSLLVSYVGHGAVERWGLWGEDNSKTFFKRSDVNSLNNTNKLAMVTVANCLNGFFTGTDPQISLSEAFQRIQKKGAIAMWAPTGLSYTSGHKIIMTNFYEALFNNKQYGLGEATTNAKIDTYTQNSYWEELVETFVLFGDPATQLGISEGSQLSVTDPNGGEVLSAGSTYTLQWSASEDMVKFTINYSLNNGRKWKKIAQKVEGASYDWNIPKLRKSKKKCRIQVIGYNDSGKRVDKDISDSTFTIKSK